MTLVTVSHRERVAVISVPEPPGTSCREHGSSLRGGDARSLCTGFMEPRHVGSTTVLPGSAPEAPSEREAQAQAGPAGAQRSCGRSHQGPSALCSAGSEPLDLPTEPHVGMVTVDGSRGGLCTSVLYE